MPLILSLLESLIFLCLIVPLDWVGLITRISTDHKEYHSTDNYQLNTTIQLILYSICEFLNDLDFEMCKIYIMAIICPPAAIFWKFGPSKELLISILGIICGCCPLVVAYALYCINHEEMNEQEL